MNSHPNGSTSFKFSLMLIAFGWALGGNGQAAYPAENSDVWESIYIAGVKVGHRHTIRTASDNGLEIRSIQDMQLARSGQVTRLRVTAIDRLQADGRLKAFEVKTEAGPTPIVLTGAVDGKTLVVRGAAASGDRQTLSWKADQGGLFAITESLVAAPLLPRQERTISALMPLLTQILVVPHKLQARGWEQTTIIDERRSLLRIDVQAQLQGQPFDSVMWTDEKGAVIKSEVPSLGIVEIRTSKEHALKSDDRPLDLLSHSLISLAEAPANLSARKQVSYRVRWGSGDPRSLFEEGPNQRVAPFDDHTVRITVGIDLPARPHVKPPRNEDKSSSSLIQTEDDRVTALAKSVVAADSALETARALERAVYKHIEAKSYSHGFATAADAARQQEGDCTEHAVLLAAVCRARGIPTRVVTGLLYLPQRSAFGFHMWNEVWDGSRWRSLDATHGRGNVGAGHVKLADSSLSSREAETAMIRVLQVMSQLEIKVEE